MMLLEKWGIIKKQTNKGKRRLKTDKIVKDENKSSCFSFIEIQHLIEGCILGDGYINKYGALTIEHSVNQAPYLFWKYHCMINAGVLTLKSRPGIFYLSRALTNEQISTTTLCDSIQRVCTLLKKNEVMRKV